MTRGRSITCWLALGALWVAGCTLAPKRFADLDDPAPLVRARALTLNDKLPLEQVGSGLIEGLSDPDPVVRLSAHEELKRRTGQDFGYQPWAEESERIASAERWEAWWKGDAAPPDNKVQLAGGASDASLPSLPPPMTRAAGVPR